MFSGVALALGVAALAAGAYAKRHIDISSLFHYTPSGRANLCFGGGVGSSSSSEEPNEKVVNSRSKILSVCPSVSSTIQLQPLANVQSTWAHRRSGTADLSPSLKDFRLFQSTGALLSPASLVVREERYEERDSAIDSGVKEMPDGTQRNQYQYRRLCCMVDGTLTNTTSFVKGFLIHSG
jgi:hypothetical protein